jgi:hypothetical protein
MKQYSMVGGGDVEIICAQGISLIILLNGWKQPMIMTLE